MRSILLITVILANGAWAAQNQTQEEPNHAQKLQSNMKSLAAKLSQLASDLELAQRREEITQTESHWSEKFIDMVEQVALVKAQLLTWKDSAQEDMGQLERSMDEHHDLHLQELTELRASLDHVQRSLRRQFEAVNVENELLRSELQRLSLESNKTSQIDLLESELDQAKALASKEVLRLQLAFIDLKTTEMETKKALERLTLKNSRLEAELGSLREQYANDNCTSQVDKLEESSRLEILKLEGALKSTEAVTVQQQAQLAKLRADLVALKTAGAESKVALEEMQQSFLITSLELESALEQANEDSLELRRVKQQLEEQTSLNKGFITQLRETSVSQQQDILQLQEDMTLLNASSAGAISQMIAEFVTLKIATAEDEDEVRELQRSSQLLTEQLAAIQVAVKDGLDQCPTCNSLAVCPDGWLLYPGSSLCVKGFSEKLDFHKASQHCKGQGPDGNLVSIHSEDQQSFLKTSIVRQIDNFKYVWIGLNDISEEGHYEWTDGSAVDLLLWKQNEPNDAGITGNHNGDCTRLWDSFESLWADTECDQEIPFICQMKAGSQVGPSTAAHTDQILDCPSGWLKYPESSKCVRGFSEKLAFNSALQHCEAQGYPGSLVSIHTTEQQEFLETEVIAQMDLSGWDIWTGLSDAETEGQFQWTDASPVDLLLWAQHPLENRESWDCMRLGVSHDFHWVVTHCGDRRPFICQIELTGL